MRGKMEMEIVIGITTRIEIKIVSGISVHGPADRVIEKAGEMAVKRKKKQRRMQRIYDGRNAVGYGGGNGGGKGGEKREMAVKRAAEKRQKWRRILRINGGKYGGRNGGGYSGGNGGVNDGRNDGGYFGVNGGVSGGLFRSSHLKRGIE